MTVHLIVDVVAGAKDKHVNYAQKRLRADVVHLLDGAGLRRQEAGVVPRSNFGKGYLAALTDPRHVGYWVITDVFVAPDEPRGSSPIRQGKLSLRRIRSVGGLCGPGEPEI